MELLLQPNVLDEHDIFVVFCSAHDDQLNDAPDAEERAAHRTVGPAKSWIEIHHFHVSCFSS